MKSLFEMCVPRDDIRSGTARDSDFAADLAQVLTGTAPPEYMNPELFFANTYPTQGLKGLLENIGLRLRDQGGEASSIFRLDTQYGGGKTHSLIALVHLANGMPGVANVSVDLKEATRVTTNPDYYSDHPGSTEQWSPGSPLFPDPESFATEEEVNAFKGKLTDLLE